MIAVCDKCLCASCWNGIFYCEESQNAGIVEKSRKELFALGREHPSYLCKDDEVLVSRWQFEDGRQNILLEGTMTDTIRLARAILENELIDGEPLPSNNIKYLGQEFMKRTDFDKRPEFEPK